MGPSVLLKLVILVIFFSADLKDAYTDCTLEHLKSCFLFLASVVDEPLWIQDLVVKLADLVLSNNFVETGCKFYLTGSMLPKGSSCSGEALDIIALAGELVYSYTSYTSCTSCRLYTS